MGVSAVGAEAVAAVANMVEAALAAGATMSTMSAPAKVTRAHLERLAVVYVRQSTLAQVREHRESTAAPVRAGRARPSGSAGRPSGSW